MSRILLTGRTGQLGSEMLHALAPLGEVIAPGRNQLDLADSASICKTIHECAPDIVVNCAAFTAVDRAESEPNLAHAVNAIGPGVLGEEARKLGALVIHYSTDYVFDGKLDRPYTETDIAKPQSIYGQSKLLGEQNLQQTGANCFTFRTSWVVGASGSNFAKTILRLASERETLNVVADQWGAPTPTTLIADVTTKMAREFLAFRDMQICGLYHLTAAGETNWHQYAKHIVSTALASGMTLKLRPSDIHPIPSLDYPLPAPRPANSRLNTTKLQNFLALEIADWKSALSPVLTNIITKL